MTIWVLTEEFNAYDQYGEYFRHAWTAKPSREQLIAQDVSPHEVDHVLKGGGRIQHEDSWYHLREVKE